MRYIIIAAGLLLLLLPATLCAQDENIRGAVVTRTGLLIVWNEPHNNFTIEVKAKTFEQVKNKNLAFLVDGKFLQVVTAFTGDFISDIQKQQQPDEKTILLSHRDWESKYLEQTVGEPLKVDSEAISLANGKPALFWSFLVPEKDRAKVKRQVFLTVCKGESVLVLNGAVTPEVSEQAVRQFLLETINTLRIRERPLSRAEAVELATTVN